MESPALLHCVFTAFVAVLTCFVPLAVLLPFDDDDLALECPCPTERLPFLLDLEGTAQSITQVIGVAGEALRAAATLAHPTGSDTPPVAILNDKPLGGPWPPGDPGPPSELSPDGDIRLCTSLDEHGLDV